MPETFFVTGTDTGVGKTHAACVLIHALRARGRRVCGYKPVASGCERTSEGLRNADALALQAAAGTSELYERINPFAYEPAIAPHLTAAMVNRPIDVSVMDAVHAELASRYDAIIIEGAGGWLVPLDEQRTIADWVGSHGWPVILVVGMRLGCINHALLAAESITRRTRLVGWIANVLPPQQPEWQANLDGIAQRLATPLLGCLPTGLPAAQVAARIDLGPLIGGAVSAS